MTTRTGSVRWSWRVPAALLVLSTIPVVAGSLRLLEIAGDRAVLTLRGRLLADTVTHRLNI